MKMKLLPTLCFACFASSVSLRAVDPMLPAIAGDFNISLGEAALLASAYSFPYAIMQLLLGPAGDAFGRTRLIRLSLAMVGLGSALCAVAPSFVVALLARMLAGAFAGGIVPVCLALVGDRTALADRQYALSRIMIATITGQMTGAAAAGLLAAAVGWRMMFVATTVVVGSAFLASLLFLESAGDRRTPFTPAQIAHGYRVVLANPASLVVFAMAAAEGLFLYGIFPFVAPLIAAHGEGGTFEAGLALASFAIGGVLYGLAVRVVLRWLDTVGMLLSGGVLAGLAYMAVATALPFAGTAALFLIAGFGAYMLHNTLQTRATELAQTARGATFALFSASLFLGQGIGPVAGGAAVPTTGFAPLFITAGALMIAAAVGAAHWLRRHP